MTAGHRNEQNAAPDTEQKTPSPAPPKDTAPSKPKRPYNREADRAISGEILEEARWMFEYDEKRHDTAQRMAVAVLTLTAAGVGLLPQGLADGPNWWQIALVAVVGLAGVATVVCCLFVLVPRIRKNGQPAIEDLRKFAHDHDQEEQLPVPVSQFVVNMLNAKKLDKESPLDVSRAQANKRMKWLAHAYFAFGATIIIAMILVLTTFVF